MRSRATVSVQVLRRQGIRMTKKRKSAKHNSPEAAAGVTDASSLQSLPGKLLQLVLTRLATEDLLAFMQTSRTMAQHVMQHSSGRLKLQLCTVSKRNWAAIRQLLQCAPPACLKLHLECASQQPNIKHRHQPHLQQLGAQAMHALLSTHRPQEEQQLPCVLQLCLQGFVLPSMVPPQLPKSCPNLHTLQLVSCCVSNSNGQVSSKDGDAVGMTSQPAVSIQTLMLKEVSLPEIAPPPADDARATRGKQQAPNYAEQLKVGLPNLTCLQLQDQDPPLELVRLWASQIKELHVPGHLVPRRLQPCISQSQHLHTLVAPNVAYIGEDLQHLLQLNSLTHLELESIHCTQKDLSSHPCAWQFLHLHLARNELSLEALACIPLHSLKAPLQLGSGQPGAYLRVELPKYEGENKAIVHTALQLLRRCGVLLCAEVLCWNNHSNDEQQQAAALTAVSPVFGQQAQVLLSNVTLWRSLFRALGATHQQALTSLLLDRCDWGDSLAQAALMQLPSLKKLVFWKCFLSLLDTAGWLLSVGETCQSFMEAMAEQPSGRRVQLWIEPAYHVPADHFLNEVQQGMPMGCLATVKATAKYAIRDWYQQDQEWLVASMKRKPGGVSTGQDLVAFMAFMMEMAG